MQAEEFATYAWFASECFYHNLDTWGNMEDHFEQLMTWLDVPGEWWTPIKSMAHGDYYVEAGAWIEAHRARETANA